MIALIMKAEQFAIVKLKRLKFVNFRFVHLSVWFSMFGFQSFEFGASFLFLRPKNWSLFKPKKCFHFALKCVHSLQGGKNRRQRRMQFTLTGIFTLTAASSREKMPSILFDSRFGFCHFPHHDWMDRIMFVLSMIKFNYSEFPSFFLMLFLLTWLLYPAMPN